MVQGTFGTIYFTLKKGDLLKCMARSATTTIIMQTARKDMEEEGRLHRMGSSLARPDFHTWNAKYLMI